MCKRVISILRPIVMALLIAATVTFTVLCITTATISDTATVKAESVEHSHEGYTAWTKTDSLPTSGNYYLTNEVIISSTLNVSGTLNLCLNDHVIAYSGSSGSVIRVNGGATLNLFDCGTTVRYYYIGASSTYNSSCLGAIVESESDSKYVNAERRGSFVGGYITGGYGSSYSGSTVFGGGVLVDGGSFTMSGGCIFGNRLSVRDGGNGGGGVAVRKTSSSFVMNGGYIIGNHAGRFGGGIRIDGGTFVMNGGEIRHNTANTPNSGGAGCGGGLHLGGLDGGPTVTIAGGIIEGNYAGLKDGRGGGINVAGGTLTVTGGTITGNNATLSGGGINGSFTLKGDATISGNTVGGTFIADSYTLIGGTVNNVYLPTDNKITLASKINAETNIGVTLQSTTGTFTSGWATYMEGAAPADYFTSDNPSYGIFLVGEEVYTGTPPHIHNDINFTAWTLADSLPTSAGNYYLTADVTISSTWSVPSGTTKLCLNGHGIKMTGNNSVVTVKAGATLKLYDCDTTTEHKYSVSNAKSNGAGLAIVNDALTSGYQTFKGGYITGGRGAPVNSWSRGGAFYIEGTVEMYGGTVIGNGRYDNTHGGGFNTQGSGTFKMYGGSIQNNAGKCGGATRLQGTDGSCEIYGGKIINNIVSADGGAIHVGGSIPVILQNCEISGNYANSGPGAGIWMTTTGTEISGRTIITNNLTNSGQSNVEIGNGYVISVGELTEGASVGIKINNVGTGTFTSGWATSMEDADPSDYFTSDAGYYVVSQNGEAVITDTLPHIHSWNYTADGNVITATCIGEGDCNLSEQTLTITADGKTYDGTAVVATLSFSDGWTVANGFEVPEIEDIEYSGNTTAGTHTASITVGGKTATISFTITCKSETKFEDKTGNEENNVAVVGLNLELSSIEDENPNASSISLEMTVEEKTEETAVNADSIIETAKNKSLEFFEIKVEKTIDSITTVLDTTSNVLEIAVPYEKVNKRGLIVYSYHGDSVRTFVESDMKEDGTFRVDKENRLIYVYANKFSTYAIGYTPYYRVQTSLSLGSYEGKASVTIKNDADENISFTLESADAKNIVFPDVPKGQYTMTIIWEDGKTNTLTMTLTVGPKAVLSAITEQDAESETPNEQVEEQETQVYSPDIGTTDESEILTEDAKIETVAAENGYVVYKAQAVNREVGLVPRKREYMIKRENIFYI